MFERQEWKFYFLFTDSVCSVCIMDWAKQNMVLISGLMNTCEIYLSTEIQRGGRGEQSTNFSIVWISEALSHYIIWMHTSSI